MSAEVHRDGAVQVCVGNVVEAGVGLLHNSHYADQVRAADLATRAVDDILATVHHLLRHLDYVVELLLLHSAVDFGDEDCQSFLARAFGRREELARRRHRIRGGLGHSARIFRVDSKERSGFRETLELGVWQRVEEVQRGWARIDLEIEDLEAEVSLGKPNRSP